MADEPKFKKLDTITDIRFGEMNALADPVTQKRFDPNRVKMTSAIRSNNVSNYTSDVIEGKERWNAIVVRTTPQKHAYVSSEFQRTFTSFERANADGEFSHFTYKIFIAELDSFKKLPEKFSSQIGGSKDSDSAGLVNLCRDAIAPLGQAWGVIDYGTPVEVVFEDQERLRNPIIVDVHWNRRINLEEGGKVSWSRTRPVRRVGSSNTSPNASEPRPYGCQMFLPGAANTKSLAIGASYVRMNVSFAKKLGWDRFARSGATINFIKGQLVAAQAGTWHATNKRASNYGESGTCSSKLLDLSRYDNVAFFVGPNSITGLSDPKGPGRALTGLINKVKKLAGKDLNITIVTIPGFWGWAEKRKWATYSGSQWQYSDFPGAERILINTRQYNTDIMAMASKGYKIIKFHTEGTVDYTSQTSLPTTEAPAQIKFRIKSKYDLDTIHPNGAANEWIKAQL